MKTKNYSDFLNQACAYVGVDYSDLQPDEVALLNSFFNKQINHIWNLYHWVDVCPYGEFRVPNNILPDSKTLGSWSTIGGSLSAKWSKNPTDNSIDTLYFENSMIGGIPPTPEQHCIYTTYTPEYAAPHTFSVFLYPQDTNYVMVGTGALNVNQAIIDIKNASVVATASGVSASVTRISGGWVQVSVVVDLTTCDDGIFSIAQCDVVEQSAISVLGILEYVYPYSAKATSGMGVYFPSVSPSDLTGTSLQLVPWEQEGMDEIDVVFDVWRTSPLSSTMPKRCPYKVTPNGIQTYNTASNGIPYYQIISPNQAASSTTISPQAPVYLYYRTRCPNFSGPTYTTVAGYAAGTTLYYTYADTVTTNYVKTLVATNPGDTPETAPEKFKVLLVPQFAFDFVVQGVLADWLMTERQFAKAQVVRMGAQEMMDREFDRQERQMGIQFPFKVHTHLTSRSNPTR